MRLFFPSRAPSVQMPLSESAELAEKITKAIRSYIANIPIIGACLFSQASRPAAKRSGITAPIYSMMNAGSNALRITTSIGLSLGEGLLKISEKSAVVAGSILTLILAYDSYVYLTEQTSSLHRINPCGKDVNFPTLLNLWLHFQSKDCDHKNLVPYSQTAFPAQIFLIPLTIWATTKTAKIFDNFATGAHSMNKRLYNKA